MGVLGELFPGRRLADEDAGATGQRFGPGAVDLDGGVVYLNRRPVEPPTEPTPTEPTAADTAADLDADDPGWPAH